jgi:hypothetical protein
MKPNEFFQKLLEARDCIHLIHWRTKSHAEHTATDYFYKKWTELIDTFAETFQGKYPRIEGPIKIEITGEYYSGEYLMELYKFIDDNYRFIISSSDSDLLNVIADMKGLINKTLYFLSQS